MKRILLVAVFALGLIVGTWITIPQANAAAAYCPATYVVRRGDTMTGIAARAGMSVWQLARFNNIWNIHYIYVGQVLCLPFPITEPVVAQTAVVPSSGSSLKLKVTYVFRPDADDTATNWTLGANGIVGKQLAYSLASGDAIETVDRPETIRISSTMRTPSPIFWLARPSATNTSSYTLVVIGNPQLLLDLQLGFTQTITQIFSTLPTNGSIPVSGLSGTNSTVARLLMQAELETGDGIFIPLNITSIDYHENVESAQQTYEFPAFALHPAPSGDGYQLLMVLNDDGTIGPPGYGWRSRCVGWRGGGWWSRWARSWYGC